MYFVLLFQVILLIYEYAIAVEWSIVQKIRNGNGNYDGTNITHDIPFADRLDRSFFGFDQDYYERMPLLVNALQESNYVDPVIEMSNPVSRKHYGKNNTSPRTFATDAHRQSKIKKSSPRPFIFEYRSATPLPFRKTYGSRSWVDSYRNAQRLQNIRQVIRYLEKTINAKSGDMHTKSTNSHTSIALSGAYVKPTIEKDKLDETNTMELLPQNSNRVETYANHNEDPLFNFKPDSPGEVNLLADTFFRFSPVPTPSIKKDTEPNKIPIFRRIPSRIKCKSNNCDDNAQNKFINLKSSTEHNMELPTSSTKSSSLMINLYPLKSNTSPEFMRQDGRTKPLLEKVYITTSRPLIHFRKKSSPMRQTYYRYKRPRYLSRNRNNNESKSIVDRTVHKTKDDNNNITMIVHVDVYSPEEKNGIRNQSIVHYTTSTIQPSSFLPITEKPVELLAGQVEDHHDGSSGLITIQIPEQTEAPTLPPITPLVDTITSSTDVNPWATRVTNPPDVFKFSAEDAKVPDHYKNMVTVPMDKSNMNWETTQTLPTEMDGRINWETTEVPMGIDRRSMNLVTTQAVPMETIRVNMDWATTQSAIDIDTRDMHLETTQVPTETDRYEHSIEKPLNEVGETLIIKLRNGITTTEKFDPTATEEIGETTTFQTYVPQINGHYRNIVAPNNLSPETYRKRKLEMSVTGFRSHVPMYTEIRRNKTKADTDSE